MVLDEYLHETAPPDQSQKASPVLVLLGGDDGLPRDMLNLTTPYSYGELAYNDASLL